MICFVLGVMGLVDIGRSAGNEGKYYAPCEAGNKGIR